MQKCTSFLVFYRRQTEIALEMTRYLTCQVLNRRNQGINYKMPNLKAFMRPQKTENGQEYGENVKHFSCPPKVFLYINFITMSQHLIKRTWDNIWLGKADANIFFYILQRPSLIYTTCFIIKIQNIMFSSKYFNYFWY